MKHVFSEKNKLAFALVEKAAHAGMTTSAITLRFSIDQCRTLLNRLEEQWKELAAWESACDRMFLAHEDGYLRYYNMESFTRAIREERITLPDDKKKEFQTYLEDSRKLRKESR